MQRLFYCIFYFCKRSPAPHFRSIRPPHIGELSKSPLRCAYLIIGQLKRIWSTEVCAFRVTAYEYRFIDFICYLVNGYVFLAWIS